MKNWQYYGLQSNIMIACSFSADWTVAKAVFLALAVLNLFLAWTTRND
jgi:hypothetical protein